MGVYGKLRLVSLTSEQFSCSHYAAHPHCTPVGGVPCFIRLKLSLASSTTYRRRYRSTIALCALAPVRLKPDSCAGNPVRVWVLHSA